MQKPKRKTHTSSEVNERYKKKTYNRYNIVLRKIEDADVIAAIESAKADGTQTSDAVKFLIRAGLSKNK